MRPTTAVGRRHWRRTEASGVYIYDRWRGWDEAERDLAERIGPDLLRVIADAFAFAVAWHGDQTRPTGDPYVWHLLETLEVLTEGAGVDDQDILVAAVLHDVVEDTPCTMEEVRERFGARVATLIKWLTRTGPRDGEDRMAAKRRYLAGFERAPQDAVLVKLADRFSNVQKLDALPNAERRRAYYRETVEAVLPLADIDPWFERKFAAWQRDFRYLEHQEAG